MSACPRTKFHKPNMRCKKETHACTLKTLYSGTLHEVEKKCTMADLKRLASQLKVPGRSKLNTKLRLITAIKLHHASTR